MSLRTRSATLIALGVIAAGCGSSSSPSSPTSAASSAASSTTPVSSSATATSSSGSSFASVGNCAQLASLGAKFAKTISAASTGGKFDLQSSLAAYQALESAAPAEIRPDLQTVGQAFAAFATKISQIGYKPGTVPSASQIVALQGVLAQFNAPKLRAAEQRLSAWARKNCHA
jgi:hypothetical protein